LENVEKKRRKKGSARQKTGGTKDDGKNKVGVREGDEITKVNLEKSGADGNERRLQPAHNSASGRGRPTLFFPAALGLLAY